MKITVSLPDAIFLKAEAIAAKKGITRSALYTAAIEEYARSIEQQVITEKLNLVYGGNESRAGSDAKVTATEAIDLYDEW